jgi:3-oxoacyl-[acyl-carrier-protein] synthase-1
MGIVSCLGNTLETVSNALRTGHGGIVRVDAWREKGFASQVAGVASVRDAMPFDRKHERFMGDTARFACHAARLAVADAGLDLTSVHAPDAGVIIGSGVGALASYDEAMLHARQQGIGKLRPYVVTHAMSSTASASVSQVFGLEGVSYSPSSACTTSALAIGQAFQTIQSGRQAVVLAGGSEALHDNMTLMFDVMGALSRGSNDRPEQASRPYDRDRDGFVIASGAGVIVLESLEHALARQARIYAELIGFGESTDRAGMVTPRASGIERAIRASLDEAGKRPDYVNAHAPSTPLGDLEELRALDAVFGETLPQFSSTKGLTGHPLGASGAHQAIYTLLMMRDGFMAGTAGPLSPDEQLGNRPLLRTSRDARIETAMSVSFGFGGSSASLVFDAWCG